jgi:hypothetical protein
MPNELTYKKVLLNEGGTQYNIVECYPDGREMIISESQDVYQAWLALGHQPTVIPYVPPTPPTPEELQRILDAAKTAKIAAIDLKTNQLILAGFSYDDKVFSLSATAQMNWIAMQARFASISYPFDVSTISETVYAIADSTAGAAFLTAAFDTLLTRKSGGVALRDQVMTIYNDTQKTLEQRISEVNAFVDPR